MGAVLIHIEGSALPGTSCGPGPDYPDGHHNIHVAVQGRKGQQDLLGLVPADVKSALWELECRVVSPAPAMGPARSPDPRIAGQQFIHLTWGVVDASAVFTMFRRAKLWLDAVPDDVLEAAHSGGLLIGRLGLTDDRGWPLWASDRPPRIEWTAGTARQVPRQTSLVE